MILLLLFCFEILFADPIPTEIDIIARRNDWTCKFLLHSKQNPLGQVERQYFTGTTDYNLYDPSHTLLARAEKEIFKFGLLFRLTDPEGNLLCTIEERVFRILPSFDIISPDNVKWVEAQMDYWGNEFLLKDPVTKEVIATLSRTFLTLNNDWKISIFKPEAFDNIDARILMLGLALQSDYLHWSHYPTSNQGAKIVTYKPTFDAWIKNCDSDVGNLDTYNEVCEIRQAIEPEKYEE